MLVIIPNDMNNLEATQHITKWLHGMQNEMIDVSLSQSFPCHSPKQFLLNLGITGVFIPDTANLSGIFGDSS